ncbi:phenylalanine--tRNA ligase subunit beta, partial [bacterium]|nr:phenylalanine--tRNA ligase subunit beta [bacterium]
MKISWLWLGEYVDINLSVKQLAERLTLTGTEIASITPLAGDLSGVLVGKVISKDKHPRADRLSVCRVDVGEEILTIVCGAPNVAVGQKVPTALLGSSLPGGFKIEAREIRGVFSQGMICSERELNISGEAAGIMILADDAPVGKPLKEVIPLEDVVLEAELTRNRSDCMSMMGIAREVAIICQTSLRKPAVTLSEGQKDVDKLVRVNIKDVEGCPRYTARLIQGVKVGPSPFWLSRRIAAAGVRSINNVVDVTNYVMLELGQPLHAFDYDLLAGSKIQVRRAWRGEKFITLDEKEHILDPEVLLICDGQKPVALAGIMGGLHSEVSAGTQNILLESAYFHPAIIRRGSKKLNISTESSQRFERGVDPNGLVFALDRAAQLIAELAGGTVERGVVDRYPEHIDPLNIILRIDRVNQILGTSLSSDQVAVFMEKLGFEIDGEDPIQVRVPTFRPDISREIDLIEEVARLYGYDKIKASIRIGGTLKITQDLEEETTNKIKSALCGLGLQEVVT